LMGDMLINHMAEGWFVLGLMLLAIEMFALGMASGVLLFAGIGAIVTGLLLWFGLLPIAWGISVLCFAVSTALSVVLLWRPFKRLQADSGVDHTPTSDLVGLRFRLKQKLTATSPGSTRYSGVEWRVELEDGSIGQVIGVNTLVEVASVDAGLFRVRPISDASSD
ncbi:MAG: NfeD family protein, partial [Mariprofundales bacterium]